MRAGTWGPNVIVLRKEVCNFSMSQENRSNVEIWTYYKYGTRRRAFAKLKLPYPSRLNRFVFVYRKVDPMFRTITCTYMHQTYKICELPRHRRKPMNSDIHTIGTANKKAFDIRIEIHVVQTRFNSSEKRVFGANSWWERRTPYIAQGRR